jgi:serine/threonine protein kinase
MPVDGTPFGDYTILQPLAKGGMAEILIARQRGVAGFGKLVVIKRLLPELLNDQEHTTMFVDEGRISSRLSHDNIVRVLDLGRIDGQYFIVMEWVAGLTVAQLAAKTFGGGKALPMEIALGLMAQAAAGLHAAHEATFSDGRPMHVVHRDVSPYNLLVTFEGIVKVVDFGIAKADERQSKTRTGYVKGRFSYMAPEQIRAQPVDRRADVFALAVILHEMLTGKRLFRRANPMDTYRAVVNDPIPPPSRLRPGLPPELDRIVLQALERDQVRRTPSGQALQEELEGLLRALGRPVGPPLISRFLSERMRDEVEKHRQLLAQLDAGRPIDLDQSEIRVFGEPSLDPGHEEDDDLDTGPPTDQGGRTILEDRPPVFPMVGDIPLPAVVPSQPFGPPSGMAAFRAVRPLSTPPTAPSLRPVIPSAPGAAPIGPSMPAPVPISVMPPAPHPSAPISAPAPSPYPVPAPAPIPAAIPMNVAPRSSRPQAAMAPAPRSSRAQVAVASLPEGIHPTRASRIKQKRSPLLLIIVIILAAALGFGGGVLAIFHFIGGGW